MGFGVFDIFQGLKGDNATASNDPNSPNYAGGSFNQAYKDVKKHTLSLFNQANSKPLVFADESGFMPYQKQGINVFANLLRGQTSADYASRGFLNPANEDAIVGSALTQAAPQLFALQNENQFMPTRMANERLNLFQPMIQAGASTLGPGVGYNNLNQANSNWWQMWNNIGSFWGGGGMKGAALKGGQSGGTYFGGVQ